MIRLNRTAATLWTAGIIIALLIPGTTLGDVPVGFSDLIAHAILFAGFGFLWFRVAPDRRVAVFLTGLALGGLLEIAQGVLPINRGAEWLDWLADGTGLVVGLLVATAIRSRKVP